MQITLLRLIAVLTLATVASSIYGLYQSELALGQSLDFETVLRIAARTVGYFFANEPNLDNPHWAAFSAQLIGPFVTAGTLWTLLFRAFADIRRKARVRKLSDHTIIVGANVSGVAFAISEIEKGANLQQHVVLLDDQIDDAHSTIAELHGFEVFIGDPVDKAVLIACGILRAKRIIVITGSDEINLEIAMLARGASAKRSTEHSKLDIYVSISNRYLWNQLARSDAINRSENQSELRPFNFATWSARLFTWQEHLWRYALLREQSAIHAVFMGYEDFAEALVGHLAPVCVHKGLSKLHCTILAPGKSTTQSKLKQSYPQIDSFADVQVIDFDLETECLDREVMQAVSRFAPVTAIFVCRESSDAGLGTAIGVRDSMEHHAEWRAPVYVRLPRCSHIREILKSSADAINFADVLQPFGVEEELCDLSVIDGWLEKCAEDFHREYLKKRSRESSETEEVGHTEPMKAWTKLPETFRQSNRRAVDTIPAKLSSLGCFLSESVYRAAPSNDLVRSSSVPNFGGELADISEFGKFQNESNELLTRLEHDSWALGRHADGWAFGRERDVKRRIHPHLIPFQNLTQDIKAYDRLQMNKLYQHVLKESHRAEVPQVQKEVRVGLIGKNAITIEEAEKIGKQVIKNILPGILASQPDIHITLTTPLAPGSDYVLTESALTFLASENISHSLIVAESVPSTIMIEDWKQHYESGYSWNGKALDGNDVWSEKLIGKAGDVSRTVVSEVILEERQSLIAGGAGTIENERIAGRSIEFNSYAERWVVDLTNRASDYSLKEIRDAGYQYCNEYLGRHVDIIIATVRGDESEGADAEIGGTQCALNYVQKCHPEIEIVRIAL